MVDVIREIPGSAALDDALIAARVNPRTSGAAQPGTLTQATQATQATTRARSPNAAPGVRGASRAGATLRTEPSRVEKFDGSRVARVSELISQHATASRASAGAQWLSRLHASAGVALASLSRWQDGDPVSQAQARRALDALGAEWQARERASLGTVDDRLHFDAHGRAPRRFTIDGVAPAQWRTSKTEQLTLYPAGPYRAGVEIDVANALSQAGLRRRTAGALAAYGITLEPPPPERGWVMSTPGAAWPLLASRLAVAQTVAPSAASAMPGGADGNPRRATLRDAPDAIAPQTWRVDGPDAVATTRRKVASMVGAIRTAHALAKNAAKASAQAVHRSVSTDARAALDGSAYDAALASAKAWTSRLDKQPPFVALTLAMPKGMPVTRANARALLGDV